MRLIAITSGREREYQIYTGDTAFGKVTSVSREIP